MWKSSKIKLPSPQERLELILLALAKRESVESLCRQGGVSRELFYRWMKAVREAGWKALEAKAPGPKRIPEEKLPERALKLDQRVRRLEKEQRALRKERDHWKLLAEVGRRILHRQGWGPVSPEESKKNAMRNPRPRSFTSRSGIRRSPKGPRPALSLGAGESAGAPTGDGSLASFAGPGQRS